MQDVRLGEIFAVDELAYCFEEVQHLIKVVRLFFGFQAFLREPFSISDKWLLFILLFQH